MKKRQNVYSNRYKMGTKKYKRKLAKNLKRTLRAHRKGKRV